MLSRAVPSSFFTSIGATLQTSRKSHAKRAAPPWRCELEFSRRDRPLKIAQHPADA
jgi:hypothetical protein